jgi:transcriptional antiterminator NusG
MGTFLHLFGTVANSFNGVCKVPELEKAAHLSEHGEALPNISAGNVPLAGPAQYGRTNHHWYALTTYPRHEKQVRQQLQLRDVDYFLPCYEQLRKWKNGQTVRVEFPLFPGYIFVEIDPAHRSRVLETPGAISLVGSGRELWPISDSQIRTLRDELHLRKFQPHAYLAAGQRVRIKAGPLANLTGILLRTASSLRVVLTLDQIMQGVAVEVDMTEIELLSSNPTHHS